jgi:transposase
MALYVRELNVDEWITLERLVQQPENDLPLQRLMIVLLSAQGERVQDVSEEVDLHPINVRKWIHRFNHDGFDGLRSGKSPGRPPVFSKKQRSRIVEIASMDPRQLGQNFNRWSLQRLRKYLVQIELVEHISVETIRQILRDNGVKHRSNRGWRSEAKPMTNGYHPPVRSGNTRANRYRPVPNLSRSYQS